MFKVKNERDKRNTFQDRDINILNLFKCDSVNDAVMCLVHITQSINKIINRYSFTTISFYKVRN